MTAGEKALRIGIAAREAARRWSASPESILRSDGDPGSSLSVERVDDLAWQWRLGEIETGRIEFRDAGEDEGEFVIQLDRSDGSEPDRLRSIVNRFSQAASGEGIDRPVVAADPHQGEPAEASTEKEQPL